ncbi:MAG: 5'-nucleotidase C-terminal domain-containing protein [Treponema sp.]|nr:5'-nucleotidase C-terminal domain-containing protein [Treponema sp.]
MKKYTALLAAISLAVATLWTGCLSNSGTDAETKLVVLHVNDHHGSVTSRKDKDGVGHGGLAERATFIKQVRSAYDNVLVLDSGDINTGMAVSNMFDAAPDLAALDAMGYDATVFGNHEFDKSLAVLKKQMESTKFPWLSANIKYKDNGKYLGTPYIIKKYKGFTVGIFGLTTRRTEILENPDESLEFFDEIETAKEMVSFLRNKKKVDILIELGHLGDVEEVTGHETSIKLAQAVEGIDLIIDGHSHSFFGEPKVVNGTPIVTSNEWGKYVGQAVLTIKNKKIVDFAWSPVEITDKAFPPDAEVSALLKPYLDKAAAELQTIQMTTSEEFPFGAKLPRYMEMAIGDLVCDATVAQLEKLGVDVDFAFHGGGTIRTGLPQGPVTKEQIITMLPFENYIYVITLKGSTLKELFEYIATLNQGAGGFAQVSKEVSYTLTYDEQGRNGKISDVTINGKPIDDNKIYHVGTTDYNAEGGDGYVILKNKREEAPYNSSLLLSDMFIEYVKSLPQPIAPKTDGRIKVIGGTLPNKK